MSDAITRKESLLKSIADGTSSSLKPITREEQYLAYIAGESKSFPTNPITREEAFLDKIAKKGAGGGGSSINVQPLNVTENGTWDAPEGQAYDPVTVDVKAITEPITITENGVYPVPKGGSLDYGKTVTFKEYLSAEDLVAFTQSLGLSNPTDLYTVMAADTNMGLIQLLGITISSNGLYLQLHYQLLQPKEDGSGSTVVEHLVYEINEDGSHYAWENGLAGEILNEPPTITIFSPHPAQQYEISQFEPLFDIETKSLDGWGDITVNVASGGGAELNIAYGDTAPEDTSKLWVKTTQPSKVKVASELEKQKGEDEAVLETLSNALPSAFAYFSGALSGRYWYGFAGNGGGVSTYGKNVVRFDTQTETAVNLGNLMDKNRTMSSAVAVGTKIYVIGGRNTGSGNLYTDIVIFDTDSKTFSTFPQSLPQATRSIGACAYGTKIYLFGGGLSSGYLNTIMCIDTESETLETLSTTLPQANGNMGCACVGNNIYLFGGYPQGKAVLKFNCDTHEISVLADGTFDDSGIATAVIGDYIYIFAGGSKTCVLDTRTDTMGTLTTASIGGTVQNSAFVVGDVIYIIPDSTSSTSVYKYTPSMSIVLPNDTVQLLSTLNRNVFKIINTDDIKAEIGVVAAYKGNSEGKGEQVEAALHNGTSWVTI